MRTIPLLLSLAAVLALAPSPTAGGEQEAEREDLLHRIAEQEKRLQAQATTIRQLLDRLEALEARMNRLEGRSSVPAVLRATTEAPPPTPSSDPGQPQEGPARVDLSADELPALPMAEESEHVLARRWFRNFRLDGFGGAGFAVTGEGGTRAEGGFLNYEATVNVDVEVWKQIHYFHELNTIRMGYESTPFLQTGEVYVDFKDPLQTFFGVEGRRLGLKLGRADIPFGEDYLSQDVVDNPLVTHAAAYPYGLDEGLVAYGRVGGVNWIVALMDGHVRRGIDDDTDKFVSLKLSGKPTENLYLSASAFRNGRSAISAWKLGKTYLMPVGAGDHISSAGASPSTTIHSYSYELDATYRFGRDGHLAVQFGQAFVDDDVPDFDRTISYFKVEPRWTVAAWKGSRLYLAGRFSGIGTFDREEGYLFKGGSFAGGDAFGFDTRALYRWALGVGFWSNPKTLLKLEYSRDEFRLISGSAVDGVERKSGFLGFQVATKF